MAEDEVLRTVVERLLVKFNVNRIVLFGSRARGDAHEDSDYDVLAEVESDIPFWQRQTEALRCFPRRRWSLDLLVMTPEEVVKSSKTLGSAVYWALKEGKVLYEKA